METLYIYIAKSCGLLVLFYLAYYLLLHKETFFTGNRWFLLAGLFTSALLPFVVYNKIVWIAPTPMPNVNFQPTFIPPIIEKETFEINWDYIILVIYSIGFLVFLIKFAIDFYSLKIILKGKKVQQQADFKFVNTNENIAPFSYFNYIVYNSSLYTTIELENIIEHEKVHSEQNHTIDVLISRIFSILFWFNPIIWLYKKAIIQNLEFIADSEASKNILDKKAYQYTLLKITTHENCIAITNHFYQSLIKKRITMLNKNQSKKKNSWKYALVIPALVAFVLLFQIEVLAKEKTIISKTKKITLNGNFSLIITKNTSDTSLKNNIIDFKSQYGITLNISKVKRNVNGEITGIKISFKDEKGNTGINQANGDKPIQPITLVKNTDKNGKTQIGFFTSNTQIESSKNSVPDDTKFFINGAESNKTEMEKLDPNEIESMSILKDKKEIRIYTKKWLKASEEFTFYIDEKKVTPQEYYSFNPEMIKCSHGNVDKKTLQIETKKGVIITNDKNRNAIPEKSIKVEKPILIINGHFTNPSIKLDDLDPGKISSITVYNSTQAIMRYGSTGGRDVIEITTKDAVRNTEAEPVKETNQSTWKVGYGENGSKTSIERIIEDKKIDYKKAIIIIDGKLSDYKSLENVDSNKIESIMSSDIKNASEENKKIAVDKYGKKALNGIIQINYKTN